MCETSDLKTWHSSRTATLVRKEIFLYLSWDGFLTEYYFCKFTCLLMRTFRDAL